MVLCYLIAFMEKTRPVANQSGLVVQNYKMVCSRPVLLRATVWAVIWYGRTFIYAVRLNCGEKSMHSEGSVVHH